MTNRGPLPTPRRLVLVIGACLVATATAAQDKPRQYEQQRATYEAQRDAKYREALALDVAGIRPGMTVGEVGAGDGYFTVKLAARVGPGGKVYANDILEEQGLALLRLRATQAGLTNIETVLGTEHDPRLPKGIFDVIFLVRTLHDLSAPARMLETLAASLKPGGTIAIVEIERPSRAPDDLDPHAMVRQDYLAIFAKTSFTVQRIDKSLPDPKSVVFILARSPVQQRARFDPRLVHGKYPVGFTVVNQYDRARAFNPDNRPGEHPRPVQTAVWYPAVAPDPARPMLYEEYVRLAPFMARFEPITDLDIRRLKAALPDPDTIRDDNLREEMKAPTSATRDAEAVSGRFPVLIYAPSMRGTPWENAELCAYLASHGYLVAASPSFGRASWPMTHDIDGLGAQADDIEFLVRFMRGYPNANPSRVGIIGYSWGGTANVIAAQRLKAVNAVLTLDGAISILWTRYSTWTTHLDPKRMDIPFMSIAPPRRSLEDLDKRGLDRTFVFFDTLDLADAYSVTLRTMTGHAGLSAAVMKLSDRFSALGDSERTGTVRGYELLARYALAFLDGYVKGDRPSLAWLRRTPAENGVPAGDIEVTSKLRR